MGEVASSNLVVPTIFNHLQVGSSLNESMDWLRSFTSTLPDQTG